MSVKKKNAIVALLLVISMVMSMLPTSGVQAAEESIPRQGWYNTEENTGDMNRVPYNNPSLITDLNMGMCAYPVVVDMNEDGIMDLLVYGGAAAEEQVKVFYGTEKGELVMEKGRKINPDDYKTAPFAATYFYNENGEYEKTGLHIAGNRNVYDAKDYPITSDDTPIINRPTGVNTAQWETIDGNRNTTSVSSLVSLVDFNGDGVLDGINAWDSWYENGWRYSYDSRYDDDGIWGGVAGTTGTEKVVGVEDGANDDNDVENGVKDGDPLHGWVAWSQNTGTDANQTYGNGIQLIQVYEYTGTGDEREIKENSGKALDVFGAPTVSFSDWDNDGDLDIIAGCWLNDLTYFENIGTRKEPVYITGRSVKLPNGEPTQTDMCQVVTTGFDWDNDGDMDLIIGEEDGRVSFIECLGVTEDDKTPIMASPVRFQAYSDSIDFGTLISIDSVDWDGDGDEDIVAGEDSGRIALLTNITIEEGLKDGLKKDEIDLSDPIWGEYHYLTNPEGDEYRIVAGYNGSLQGTSEELFGYSKIDTGDWDGDGILDIISNNIWGIILFHKGVKTTDGTFQAENPVPIEVNWTNGVKYPEYNWWAPGEETLGDDITDPAGREYKAQWSWWNDVKSANELVVQWRTSPCILELPIKDAETQEVRTAKGLALIDHEGYLSFFERCADGTVNEGQRIFMDANKGTPLQMVEATATDGQSGRRQFVLADYNKDGKLDYIANNGINATYRQNVATEEGVYQFGAGSTLHSRTIAQHATSPTVCDWDKDGYWDVLIGDEGGNVYYLKNTIYHPVEEEEVTTGETLPTDFTRITPADFGIADGIYSGTATTASTDKPVLSLNQVLFETTVQYDEKAGYLIYGGLKIQTRSDGWMRIFNEINSADVYVNGAAQDYYYDIHPQYALNSNDTTFLGEEYKFAITTEYVDYYEDGSGNTDLKIGFWFNDKLYLERYVYILDCIDAISVPTISIFGAYDVSTITISSQDLFDGFTCVTPADFGIENGEQGDVTGSKKPITTLDKVMLRATLKFTAGNPVYYDNFSFQMRKSDDVIRLWNYYGGDYESLYVNGADTGLTYKNFRPSIALGSDTTTFIGTEFRFAVTTEYIDYDGDGNKDDIKIGVWFNEKLYDNKYIYVKDITGLLGVNQYKLAFNNTKESAVVTSTSTYEMVVQPEITDSIAMNYTLTVDPMVLKMGDVSMTFDMNGRDTIKVAGVPTVAGGNVFTYKYTDIMGQNMADDVSLKLQIGSNTKYYDYSVLDYCVYVLKAETLNDSAGNELTGDALMPIKELVVDLVQYGAALQTYRGVAEHKLLTTKLAAQVPGYEEFEGMDVENAADLENLEGVVAGKDKLTTETEEVGTQGCTWTSVGLVLNNKVKIRGTFTADNIDNLTVKAVIGGEELEDALKIKGTATEGVYEVDFDNIYAYEYAKQISFRFYEGEKHVGKTLNYSVNTYLCEMYTDSDKLASLLVAINNYGDAANACRPAQ